MPGHRVSILSLHYPPDATGIAPYAGALAAGLEARHHRVNAYVAHPFYPEWKIREGYGQWRRTENVDGVAVRRVRHYVPRPPRGIRRLVSELSFGARLCFCRFGSGSVVVAVSPALFATALVALRIKLMPSRPRFVVWVQDIYTLGLAETKEGGGLTARVTKSVEKFALSAADSVVAIHPRFADYLDKALGVDAERISVIQNWTHLAPAPEMSRKDARAALGWPIDVRLIVHTGNMGAKQGLENVVEAARLADRDQAPVKFVLVGDGGERTRLEELASGIDRLQFVDPLNEADYRCALAAADCLLVNELPGVATMAVPSKLTSYFAASRPVLAATDPKGITASEVERAGGGVSGPAGYPRALLDTALHLAEDVDAAVAYGDAGRRYCRTALGAEAALDAFDRVIRNVEGTRVGRAADRSSTAIANG
jgi:colanic acid biosynthesis glycosyl transferase WcaI